MEVSIKNMVCPRCIRSVTEIAQACGLSPVSVTLGSCVLDKEPDAEALWSFRSRLEEAGFEVLSSREEKLVQAIKTALLELVYSHPEDIQGSNISDYLQQVLGVSYSLARNIFSGMEGRSIENYFISLRIERAKELVRYDELSLAEIADQLGYSSSAHLSAQFKKMTGLTPSQFRCSINGRDSLDSI